MMSRTPCEGEKLAVSRAVNRTPCMRREAIAVSRTPRVRGERLAASRAMSRTPSVRTVGIALRSLP